MLFFFLKLKLLTLGHDSAVYPGVYAPTLRRNVSELKEKKSAG